KIDAAQSLTARPFFYNKFTSANDFLKLIDSAADLTLQGKSYLNNQIQFNILPASIITKFNSHHPYGWNDAGMIMAKGLQTMVSAGVYAKAGPLTIQLQPEYYYAANPNYANTSAYGFNSGKAFSKAYLGQSSVRLNLGPVSVGVSSENLWWGPGQFSSLMMSNNAPGFQHFTLNTTRPLKTPIGSFEWQLIAGKLEEDTSAAFENFYMKPFNPKNEWRYLNAIVVTYQPKFLPNFFLGLTRSEHFYKTDQDKKTGFAQKYLPVFLASSPTANASSASIPSDGAFSFFTRWILPKHQAEFYLEYGYNDFKQNLRDFATNANHSSAYIAGFKKIITLTNKQLLDISGELTQMAQTTSYVVRSAGNWYEHGGVTQGLSFQNQNLGAGSGMGNNVQTLQVKKLQGFNMLGIKLQRIQQDPKGGLGYGTLPLLGMRPFQWNDLALGFLGQHRFNKLLINGEMQLVNSKNYGWEKGNAFNLFIQCKASYFF
ncbi:MAG: capsule assembly Wzi family protein, partial [Sediminibacterium sp.]|nr:capsule assembly Wzi family protein [Sediminibacterium sp.]